jgi:hypothetical protein
MPLKPRRLWSRTKFDRGLTAGRTSKWPEHPRRCPLMTDRSLVPSARPTGKASRRPTGARGSTFERRV